MCWNCVQQQLHTEIIWLKCIQLLNFTKLKCEGGKNQKLIFVFASTALKLLLLYSQQQQLTTLGHNRAHTTSVRLSAIDCRAKLLNYTVFNLKWLIEMFYFHVPYKKAFVFFLFLFRSIAIFLYFNIHFQFGMNNRFTAIHNYYISNSWTKKKLKKSWKSTFINFNHK